MPSLTSIVRHFASGSLKAAATLVGVKTRSDMPATGGYDANARRMGPYMASNWQKRPPFSLAWADLMRIDHQVKFGMCVRNGPLYSMEVEVDSPRPDVKEFVERQWKRLWSQEAEKLLRDQCYGYLGYEVMYRYADGEYQFDRLIDRHPMDTRPLTLKNKYVGTSFHNVRDSNLSQRQLFGPAALWLTYDAEHGSLFGNAILESPFDPWYEKTMESGAKRMRQLRMVKDAYIGDVIYYDENSSWVTPAGTTYTGRDLAIETGENRSSGGMLALPMRIAADGSMVKLVEYSPPTSVQGSGDIFDWVRDLDWDILDGLEIPKEVIEASETGSGYSGRVVPNQKFLAGLNPKCASRVRQAKEQIMVPLVAANLGADAADEFDIKPVPLEKMIAEGGESGGPKQPPPAPGRDGPNGPAKPKSKPKPPEPKQRLRSEQFASDGLHEFSCLMFNLPGELAFDVRQLGNRIEQHDLAADGREDNPHITVKFGLHTNDPDDVRTAIGGEAPVAIQFGKASFFSATEYDVVKIEIESKALHRLNAKISDALQCTDTHPEYKPHCTIAYVKPGLGEHYAAKLNDMQGRVAVFDRIVFSDKSREWISIPLTGSARFSADDSPQAAYRSHIRGRLSQLLHRSGEPSE